MRRPGLLIALALAALSLAASGCSSGETKAVAAAAPKPVCKYRAGWQKLANRIDAPVYCPGWLPDPLTAQLGGRWNNIDSVDPDRSYLMSFVWQETGGGAAGGELHVNLRGYPGRTAIPRCTRGGKDKTLIPCFSDPRGKVRANGITATMFTVNQDADQWHILLAWRYGGSLYTLSEHVAPPLTYRKVVAYLKRELRSLVLIEPST
ncbi:MAG TPA: hypothetical protein VGJ77_06120 [Gaiellaceae bacterium]